MCFPAVFPLSSARYNTVQYHHSKQISYSSPMRLKYGVFPKTDPCLPMLLLIYMQYYFILAWIIIGLCCSWDFIIATGKQKRRASMAKITSPDPLAITKTTLIARFVGPTWGPSGADRTQVGPMLAPWTLLSGQGLGNFCRHTKL